MGTVEVESKELCSVSSTLAENTKVQGSEKEKNEVKEALGNLKCDENGVGEKGGVVEVVKSSVIETKVSVVKEKDSQVVDCSEINNGVSLLKMEESDGSVVREKVDSEGNVEEGVVLSGDGFVGVDGEERKDGKEKENEEGEKDENCNGNVVIIDVPIVEISENIDVEVNEKEKENEEGKKDENGDGKVVTFEVPIVETSENVDVEVEDLIDEKCDFSVGDFVWGKIKSHPWWPGRVYDPSDASDFALNLKLKQKNRLLVAYFGDGTFAWCHPSQLKPFKENFDDMVRQSSSKGFTNAAQEAVNEVGRILVMKMSRSFVAAWKTESEFAPMLAENAGIKEGVLVPESGIERLTSDTIELAELLSQVKQIAETVEISSILELEILKARLSVFYLLKGGYKLAFYEDPQWVPGLEDEDDVVEAPSQGPFEEDYSTLPLSPKSGSRSNCRRKQKSIADIMEEDKDVDSSDEVLDATKSSARKKRKYIDDAATAKPVRKRKESDGTSVTAGKEGCVGKENSGKGEPLRSNEKQEAFGNETDEVVDTIRSTGKKKRKYSEDVVTPKQVQKKKELLIDTNRKSVRSRKEGREDKENSNQGKTLRSNEKKEEAFGDEEEDINDGGNEKENDEGKSKDQNEKGFLSRERKKSKYLSPPYTTSIRDLTKGKLSRQVSKRSGEASQELELSDSSNQQTQEDGKKAIDPEKVKVPLGKILSKIRNVAISPQISREGSSVDEFVDFIIVLRSSLFHEGSLHKVYNKSQLGRKRKEPESELDQSDHISPIEDSEPTKKKEETSTSMSKGKKKKKARVTETSENFSPAVLFVSFWPGSTLPSKSDLITIYSKFGALNEEETNMFRANYTARVSFLRTCDAKKALNDSQKKNPFESCEVTFQLHFAEAGSKSGGDHSERSKSKASQNKNKDKTATTPSLPQGTGVSKLNFVKQKLQGLLSMLESSDDKLPDFKTKVESKVKGLLEDVNNMVESTSS